MENLKIRQELEVKKLEAEERLKSLDTEDVKKIRRRLEDHLRKKPDEALAVANLLGI